MFVFDLEILPIDAEPKCDIGICSDCGWRGLLTDCHSYKEQESWEMPDWYWIFECPKCKDGGCIDDYDYSPERQKEWEEWKEKNES